MRAVVDQELCIGCGLCAGMCPKVFRMNADGQAEAYTSGEEAEIQEAIDGCPVEAISEDE